MQQECGMLERQSCRAVLPAIVFLFAAILSVAGVILRHIMPRDIVVLRDWYDALYSV